MRCRFTVPLYRGLPSDVTPVPRGHGTVRKIARQLLGKHIPIAVLPLGTANNISSALKHSLPVEGSNELWMNLETQPFDVGMVTVRNDKEFLAESAGCGAVAEMIYRYRKERKKNPPTFNHPQEEINYVRSFMKDMLHDYQPCDYEIVIDDQAISGKYLLVEVMNITSVGPHLKLAPQAEPGDGWLDVVLVHHLEKEALYTHLSALNDGQEEKPNFTVKRGKRIAITASDRRGYPKFHVDDEVLPSEQQSISDDTIHLEIAVENDRLRLFKNSFTLPDEH